MRRGQPGEAIRLCREALLQDPKDHRSLVLLAYLLRRRREFAESAALAERAIQLQPKLAEAHFQLAMDVLAMGRPDQAIYALKKATDLEPGSAPYHFHLGTVFESMGRHVEAKRCYLEAARLDPNELQVRLCLVAQFLKDEEVGPALEHAEAAIRVAPASAVAHLLMAEVLQLANDRSGADASVRKAVTLEPKLSIGHAMLGFRELQAGRFAEAEPAFRRSIELDAVQGLAYLGLTQTKRIVEADQKLVRQMEKVRGEPNLQLREKGFLHFALAKAYESLGRFEEAMGEYDQANRCTHAFRYGSAPFDQGEYRKGIDAIRRSYNRAAEPGPDHSASDLPILIVGMPRSGTTLAEQILSSHPDVGAAGEYTFWQRNAGRWETAVELATRPARMRELAEEYVQALRNLSPETPRVTDKLPGNYLRLGLIHRALPNAKLIHCRRDPLDTALSIYTTPNGSAPSYLLTKEGIVFAYRQYLELMAHWRQLLPPSRLLEVRYEDLVEDPEPVIRNVLEFCELDWNDACLHPERNAKEVSTPSLWQVRQPIYKTSVERWRRYDPWLGALRELMDC